MKFGLIGKNIDYSFSRGYFANKFEAEKLAYSYVNFDIPSICKFPDIIAGTPDLKGLNVTIPYKQSVMAYLDDLDDTAKAIGAVNTIKFNNGKLIGYNTDYFGFKKSIQPYLNASHVSALILGTGGAAKAVGYALKQLGISYDFVSRSNSEGIKFTYKTIEDTDLKSYQIIINTTPLGTFPDVDVCPLLPYTALNDSHVLFDLIYNPIETKFLKQGKTHGTVTLNGEKMLAYQADEAWKVWTK